MILPEVDLHFAHAKQQTTSNQILHQHHHRHHHHHPRGRRRCHRCHASLRSSDVPSATVRRRSAAAGPVEGPLKPGQNAAAQDCLASNKLNQFETKEIHMCPVSHDPCKKLCCAIIIYMAAGTTLTCAPGNRLTYAPGKFTHLRTWK